jgi:hypothetical protein
MQPNHDPNTTSFNFGHVKSTRLHVHVSDNTLLPYLLEISVPVFKRLLSQRSFHMSGFPFLTIEPKITWKFLIG